MFPSQSEHVRLTFTNGGAHPGFKYTHASTLNERLEPNESLKKQLQTRPETHFSKGVIAVIGWAVEYKHDFSKEIWYEDNRYPPYFYAIFYAPVDNLTLYLEPGKYVTPDDFAYPLRARFVMLVTMLKPVQPTLSV